MSTIVQLSDPHFGTELPHVAAALQRLVKSLSAKVLIVSGDITQRAQRDEFAAARKFIDQLGIANQLVVPGNHDIPLFNVPARALMPYRGFRRVFGKELEPTYSARDLLVITVNTTRRYRHVDGEVSNAQLERVETLLKNASKEQLRIVVTHQPVSVLRTEDEVDLLHRHAGAIRRWTAAGVDLILGGHIHLPFIVPLHEQYSDLTREAWAVQAGTCMSSRLRHEAGNSINVIRYQGYMLEAPTHGSFAARYKRCCSIERWDYQVASDSFEQFSVHNLLCDAPEHA